MAKKRAGAEAGIEQDGKDNAAKRKHPQKPDLEKSRLSEDTLQSAVKALLQDSEKHEKRRARRAAARGQTMAELDENDVCVYLCITLREPPYKSKLRPIAIPLKHSLYTEGEDEICFFVKDPQRQIKDYFEEHGNGGVTRVMGVDKLRKRYGTHESRRELLQMYDLFIVDSRVAPMMPQLLGNAFLEAHKMPLAVDMRKDVVPAIKRTISSAAFYMRQGTSTTLRVGRTDFETEQILENITAAIDGVVKRLARGWNDIQSVNIKTNSSPALPVYIALPTPAEPFKKAKEDVKKGNETIEKAKSKGVSAKFQTGSKSEKRQERQKNGRKETGRLVVEDEGSSSEEC